MSELSYIFWFSRGTRFI